MDDILIYSESKWEYEYHLRIVLQLLRDRMSIFEIRSFLGLAGYYRRFENGLKLSIRGRIVGFPPTGHGLHGWGGPDHRKRD